MYKVLLVDDEIRNYKLFEKLVNWEEKGFEIIGTAADGVEALKKYEELEPDLIFMDIQLPMMDGMECIRWIREVDKEVQIVIVSAYGEFNYAQKAIRYGVQDFLLKPVSRVMLNQIVNRMKENLDHRENNDNCFNNELAVNLREWIHGESEKTESLGLSKRNKLLRILIKDKGTKEHAENIKEMLEKNSEIWGIKGCVLTERYIYLIIEENSEGMIRTLAKQLQDDNYHIELYLWSENAADEEKQRFQNPELEFDNYGFYKTKEVIYNIEQMPYMDTDMVKSERESVIQNALLHREAEILEAYTTQMFEFAAQEKVRPGKLKECVLELLLYLKLALNKYEEMDTTSVLRNVRMEDIYHVYSAEVLKEYVTKKIREVFEFLHMNGTSRFNSSAMQAKIMADQHFCEKDFSVQKVADEIGISKNYFISMYKTQMGTGYWEYVTQLRMEKAQDLLRMTDDTIILIADKVGYDNEYYFSRKFKAYYGMSPRAYRKIHSK